MQPNLTISRIQSTDDLETLMALLEQQYDYHLALEPTFEQSEGWQEVKRAAYLQHLADPGWLVLLGRVDDQPAAFLAATVRELPPIVKDRRQGFIEHLFVRPEFRRLDIGTQLVERGLEWLRAQGVGAVELWVLANNDLGQRFWSRTGFRPVRQTMRRSLKS